MINGELYIYERTNSYIIKNCSNIPFSNLGYTSKTRSGYCRFVNNTINGNISIKESSTSDLIICIKNCNINGRAEATTVNNSKFLNCTINSHLTSSSSYDNSLGTGTFVNCIISNKTGNHNYSGNYYNCNIINVQGRLQGIFNFYTCSLNNFIGHPYGDDKSINFYTCNLINSYIKTDYWNNGASILFDNCEIDNTDFLIKLPHYSMKYPIKISNNIFTSKGSNGMIYFYDDRIIPNSSELAKQDTLTLKNNSITLNNSMYIITGLTKNTVNNINIISISNFCNPTSLLLCDPTAKYNTNILITEQ